MGLLYHDEEVSDGYLLMSYKQDSDLYLLDTCGQVVNSWTFNSNVSVSYLSENGEAIKFASNEIEIRDWDDNLVWLLNFDTHGISLHHDIELLPNGNILVLARDFYSPAEATAQGRDTDFLLPLNFSSERVLEIRPIGTNDFEIVWEWKFWDHLIQDFDNTKPNYGVVADHPELMDLNFDSQTSTNWLHTNGIDYNETLDQIVISSRTSSEIYIIDHSTTTLEASSSSGGNSGKGGDILWRWGNPENYNQGDANSRLLYGQHDPRWIPDGYPNAGMISVFNNGLGRPTNFSTVNIIETQFDVNGQYTVTGNVFAPLDFDWTWSGDILNVTMYSNSQSGANMQPNGNFVICEATTGRISEINLQGELLWSYKNPVAAQNYAQGSAIPLNQNVVFKAQKYPSTFLGFQGNDFNPQGILENENTISQDCISSLSINDIEVASSKLYPNPFIDRVHYIDTNNRKIESVIVYDISGKQVSNINLQENQIIFNSDLSSGLYFIRVQMEDYSSAVFKIAKK
ncbi:aryl-sulfate sulfotransferase [Lacinutrix himadriensis]|uniref:aryl-sulfate sulfotransferase n=1 Tax=Lacinutrix himadriensis TaxID=641549 RepID=UPI0006E41C36|nr:aryl-sulfate sulfotransferase [Lacinutrix himadriensis]